MSCNRSSNPAPPRSGTPQCCLHLLAHQQSKEGPESTPLMPRPVSKASPKAANFTEVKLPSEYQHTSSSCLRRSSACMQHNPTDSTPHPFWGKSKRRNATNQLFKGGPNGARPFAPQGSTHRIPYTQGLTATCATPVHAVKTYFVEFF